MPRPLFAFTLLALAVTSSMVVRADAPAAAPASQPAIDPKADALLHQACDFLAAAHEFTFETHSIAEQVLGTGQAVQVARNQKLAVRRPAGISSEIVGDRENLTFSYDGHRAGLVNQRDNTCASIDAPPTNDAMLDEMASKYGMTIPLSDFFFADPYKALIGPVKSGVDLGPGYVFNVSCRHLAFRQENVDWEVWIEDGNRPFFRKVAITYHAPNGYPQYTAFLTSWNLSPGLQDSQFIFAPPSGARKVDFAPLISPSTQPATAPSSTMDKP